MKKYVAKFYGIGIMVLLLLIAGIFNLFMSVDMFFNKQVESSLRAKSYVASTIIHSEISKRVQIVEDTAVYAGINSEPSVFEEYLRTVLKSNNELSSIYYVTPDNRMINGSGWIPPDDFDLRERPWYIQAAVTGGVSVTDLFLNASSDKWILTISKPVYDSYGDLQGVIGADVAVNQIAEILEGMTSREVRYFLVDDQKTMINPIIDSNEIIDEPEQLSGKLADVFENRDGSIILTKLGGKTGYILFTEIENTNLWLGSFVPYNVYVGNHNTWLYDIAPAFVMILALFLGELFLQKKIILKPMIDLSHDIRSISVMKDPSYRLPCLAKDPFLAIRASMNKMLDDTEGYIKELERSRRELEASHEEMAATIEQLKAYEDEILAQNRMLNESKELLSKKEEKNKAIVNVLSDIIFQYDMYGNFLECQMNTYDNLLLPKEQFIGKNMLEILPKNIAEMGIKCIQGTLETGVLHKFEYMLEINNQTKYFETRMIKTSETEVLAIVRDITFEKKEKDYIIEISYKDYLTGLFNRRYFDEELENMNNLEGLPLMIMMIDVNGLKLTNDAFGHLAGDELLKKVARILLTVCPDNGFASRIGGDEFAIVCPNYDVNEAKEITNSIDSLINDEKMNGIKISVSIGWEIRHEQEQTNQDTFIKAENNMFKRKLVESQSMRYDTIQVIMQTLNEKSEREKKHSVQVSEWSVKIGNAMSLTLEMVKEIEMAGLLHDIGKIAVGENILNKPGKLTESEYDEIKRHPESGYQILKSVDLYTSLAEYVLTHHERFDGNGYPRGLKGNEIPLIARIISVADAFEAMISDRSYRKGMSVESALEEIKHCSGTQFDPEVVKSFLGLFS